MTNPKNLFWPHAEAQKILAKKKPDQKKFIFETGYGPSGLPHIGTFAEVARANCIMLALKELMPEAEILLIAFSDDRDGLRKLPPNIPNHSVLQPYLGMPLTRIPDPFGQYDSFAGYMNEKLKSFLDYFGFSYQYISSSEFYDQGSMDPVIRKIAEQYEQIRQAFIKTIRPEKRADWSPIMPICENCGRVYTTKVESIDLHTNTCHYHCSIIDPRFPFCGHKGQMPLVGKNLKLGWKVDWGARWWALDVDYELHGEDLTDSVKVSKEVVKILGKPGPLTYKYELFLDEMGLKISKTKGNSITIEDWLKYAPVSALLHFLFDNPNKPKKMGLNILPKLIDDYFQAEKTALTPNIDDSLWYIHQISTEKQAVHCGNLSYSLLVSLIESLGTYDKDILLEYCLRYDPQLTNNPYFPSVLEKAIAYTKEISSRLPTSTVQPDQSLSSYLKILHQYFLQADEQTTPMDAQVVQKKIFSVAKENNLVIKDWFKFLYQTLLQKNEGPKLGAYFAMLGAQKSAEVTATAIDRLSNDQH